MRASCHSVKLVSSVVLIIVLRLTLDLKYFYCLRYVIADIITLSCTLGSGPAMITRYIDAVSGLERVALTKLC